jgi:hypothetical protein
MDASVKQIVREIEAHLERHPDASDTAAAIERWWLSHASNRPSTLIAQALETLVARGTVAIHQLPSGVSVYRRSRAA